jgi:signal recognition particle subunit SRP54
MFESLTTRLQTVFQRLRGRGRLSEKDVADACREIRFALLEADVSSRVAQEFIQQVSARAVGQEVMQSLTPGQQVVKIVNEELIRLLGSEQAPLALSGEPAVVMLVGLQGGGKTTTAAKLALLVRKQGLRPLLAATDTRRPAAIQQLKLVGAQVEVPVFELGDKQTPLEIARAALAEAKREDQNPLIVDTGGRTHIDSELMEELVALKQALSPQEILLVVDAMTGQDAVNIAGEFNRLLDLSGFILSKLDGDARGGAALSLRAVTGKPIKFVGVGEKPEGLEVFHPDRMASRLLGMGDVLTLVEQAEAAFAEEEAEKLERRLREKKFDLNDFLAQFEQLGKMGSLEHLFGLIPGLGGLRRQLEGGFDLGKLKQMRAILQSMTAQERARPELLNGSRRRRIARGSGTTVQAVNLLLGQFRQMKALLGELVDFDKKGKSRRGIRFPVFPG